MDWQSAPFWEGELGFHLTQCGLGRRLPPCQVPSWAIQQFGHNRHGPKIGGPLFGRGELSPHLTQCRLHWGLAPCEVASWSIQQFGHNRYGPKIGAMPLWVRGAGSPSNTMWPGLRPTCMPSFILMHPTVWSKCRRYENIPVTSSVNLVSDVLECIFTCKCYA